MKTIVVLFALSFAVHAQSQVRLISVPNVAYPGVAYEYGIAGDVEVRVTINAGGKFLNSKVLSGPTQLRQAAVSILRGATYLCRNCEEPEQTRVFTVSYHLHNDGRDQRIFYSSDNGKVTVIAQGPVMCVIAALKGPEDVETIATIPESPMPAIDPRTPPPSDFMDSVTSLRTQSGGVYQCTCHLMFKVR
jgi:hypothetical protein